MSRRNTGMWLLAAVIAVIALFAVPFVAQMIFGSDYERGPIEVGDPDLGAQVIIESGDDVHVMLMGHPSHFDAGWTITALDEQLVELVDEVHVERDGGWEEGSPPPEVMAEWQESVRDLWSTIPERTDPPDYQAEGEPPMWYWPMTHFDLAGKEPGKTDVMLELRVAGELIHSFVFSITVVEGDACEFFESGDSPVKVPHRCG